MLFHIADLYWNNPSLRMHALDSVLEHWGCNHKNLITCWVSVTSANSSHKPKHEPHFEMKHCYWVACWTPYCVENDTMTLKWSYKKKGLHWRPCRDYEIDAVLQELVWRSKLFTRAASNWLCDKMGDESEYEKQERTALLKLFSVCTSV